MNWGRGSKILPESPEWFFYWAITNKKVMTRRLDFSYIIQLEWWSDGELECCKRKNRYFNHYSITPILRKHSELYDKLGQKLRRSSWFSNFIHRKAVCAAQTAFFFVGFAVGGLQPLSTSVMVDPWKIQTGRTAFNAEPAAERAVRHCTSRTPISLKAEKYYVNHW